MFTKHNLIYNLLFKSFEDANYLMLFFYYLLVKLKCLREIKAINQLSAE